MKLFATLAFLSFLLLPGCGLLNDFSRIPSPGTTTVSFSSARDGNVLEASTALNGGVMIYAKLQGKGTSTFPYPSDAAVDGASITLPNGTYNFYFVGWPNSGLSGALRCGATASQSLSGTATSVSVSMSAAGCVAAPFADPFFTNGASLRTLGFSFCDHQTDLSQALSDCTGGYESSRFFHGVTAGAYSGVLDQSGVDFNFGTDRFVYIADPHVAGRLEVYSVNPDGTGTIMQSHPITTPGVAAKKLQSAPGASGLVAYTMLNANNAYDLYVTQSGVPGDLKISPSAYCSGTCAANSGVTDFEFTPDGNYLVFVDNNVLGNAATPTVSSGVNVYSVKLSGISITNQTAGVIQLNHTSGGGLQQDGGGSVYITMSPASPYPVLFTEFPSANRYELYLATPDGANLLDVGATHAAAAASPAAALGVFNYDFNFDGSKIVWIDSASSAWPTVNTFGTMQACTYSSPATLCAISVDVTPTQYASGFQGVNDYWVSPYSDHLVVVADQGTANAESYYSVDISSTTAPVIVPVYLEPNPSTHHSDFPQAGAFTEPSNGTEYMAFAANANDCAAYPSCSGVYNHAYSVQVSSANSTPIQVSLSGSTFTATSHGLAAGTAVVLATTGSVPTGLSPATPYFVVNPTTNNFQLAATPAGSPVSGTGGTGTLYVAPRVPINSRLDLTGPAAASITSIATTDGTITTSVAHGLSVGSFITLSGTDLPPEMPSGYMYYVKTTATSNTLTISLTGTGSAIIPSVAGSGSINQVQPSPISQSSLAGTNAEINNDVFTIFTDLESTPKQFITFLSDSASGTAGLDRLFVSTPGQPSAIDTSSMVGAPPGNVQYEKESRGRIYLTATNSGGVSDGFVYDPSVSPAMASVNVSSTDYSGSTSALFPLTMSKLDFAPDGYEIGGNPFGLLLGYLTGNTPMAPDLWFLPSFSPTATPTPVKLTPMENPSPLGSYRISLMAYSPDVNGNPTGLTPAFSSACAQGSVTQDGAMNSTPLYLPPGQECVNGACPYNPFILALDVYPGQTGCTGTSQRTVLTGLTGMQTPTSSSSEKIIQVNASQLGLFIRD